MLLFKFKIIIFKELYNMVKIFINLEFESMNVFDDDKIDSVNNVNLNVVSISF